MQDRIKCFEKKLGYEATSQLYWGYFVVVVVVFVAVVVVAVVVNVVVVALLVVTDHIVGDVTKMKNVIVLNTLKFFTNKQGLHWYQVTFGDKYINLGVFVYPCTMFV